MSVSSGVLEEHLSQRGDDHQEHLDVKRLICLGMGSSIQLVLLIIDPNLRFVKCGLIQILDVYRLQIGILSPIVGRFPPPIDTQIYE